MKVTVKESKKRIEFIISGSPYELDLLESKLKLMKFCYNTLHPKLPYIRLPNACPNPPFSGKRFVTFPLSL
jgi:hypothetical protein